ncbi:hypothetical protein NMG29_39515 [Streptomyces cocklensis]|uniref:Uncharacterized protein n=1 Tax=Actinacidiphila cocklensis TaxID=887465 RepID=A0A9W4EBA7_9ACTN|nr:hypothetical protein [Actinacidiphila cocklensis]MDD1064164.1 hypothetical protein [Actinacidiphila cocklensis]CAG6398299.1 exported hypothetical protein [Actinacidiphila cocklensis]
MNLSRTRPAAGVTAPLAAAVLASTIAAEPAAGERSVALHQAVAALPVAAEDRTGYNRESSFCGWIDADHDGCDTRKEVLLEEAVTAPTVTGTCTLTGGTWLSWYDDTTVDRAGALDINHVLSVPATSERGN